MIPTCNLSYFTTNYTKIVVNVTIVINFTTLISFMFIKIKVRLIIASCSL